MAADEDTHRTATSSAVLLVDSDAGEAGQPGFTTTGNETIAGAPVEEAAPLGREVTLLSAIMLNLGYMLGAGIFSVPGVILKSVGSVGLLLFFWVLAPIFAFAGLSVFSELASMFPNRSGAEVVYLEQAFPRPKYLVSTAFAVVTVLLSMSVTNCVVFAQYFMASLDITPTPMRQTLISLAVATTSSAVVGVSTKWSLRIINGLTAVKVICHIFVIMTGLIVLCGFTHISDPFHSLKNPWVGSTLGANTVATALVKTNFAFDGYHNAFNVLGEVRGKHTVRTVRNASRIALGVVSVLFFLTNIAYIAAVPVEEIKNSGQMVAALFFAEVFGRTWIARMLPVMVACSCVGNIMAVAVGKARIIREIARQGLLPYPTFFASTVPFGTPLGPVAIMYFLTACVLIAMPAQDVFSFYLDFASYPKLFFAAGTAVGLWVLRRRRKNSGIEETEFKANDASISLYLFICFVLIVVPWIPPAHGRGDVSFWYATYCVAGIVLLLLCGLYYWLWIVALPRMHEYEIVEKFVTLKGGARVTKLVRRYHRQEETGSEREPLLDG